VLKLPSINDIKLSAFRMIMENNTRYKNMIVTCEPSVIEMNRFMIRKLTTNPVD
jgi:hypothetical protein